MVTTAVPTLPLPENAIVNREWLTVREAALQLGNVSTKLIYKMYHRGDLEGAKIAGTVRIRASSVAAYLESHSNRKEAPSAAAEVPLEQTPATAKRRRPASGDFTSYYREEMAQIDRKRPGR